MKKLILICILGIVSLLILGIFLTALGFYIFPKPGIIVIGQVFNSKVQTSDQHSFEKANKSKEVTYNQQHDSKYKI